MEHSEALTVSPQPLSQLLLNSTFWVLRIKQESSSICFLQALPMPYFVPYVEMGDAIVSLDN